MKHDNPIEEIWRIREVMGAQEDYDVHRLFQRLRREEKSYADRLVRVEMIRASDEATSLLHDKPPKSDQLGTS